MAGRSSADVAGEIRVRPIAPGDAPGVSELIVRCYGDAYPKRIMYRPAELAELVRSGAYDGVVAEARAAVVGHIGFTLPAPASTVVEAGTTVVDPGARGQGLMGRLALALAEAVAAQGAAGFIHFPTTAHQLMQRASVSAGGRETGILLAYLPGETRDLELGAPDAGRLAVTVVYQPVAEAPAQRVCLPRRYAELIGGMAASLGLSRHESGSPSAPAGSSRLEHASDAARGLERISVARIGADIDTAVSSLARAATAGVVHVDLPMSDPAVDHAVELLRRSAFTFAAWLPGWAGHDVLRMQRVAPVSDGELSPALSSPEAEALMSLIRAEISGSG